MYKAPKALTSEALRRLHFSAADSLCHIIML